ncbi:MAG: RNA-binding domain-containing protein [Conexivisphaerales archaeon]
MEAILSATIHPSEDPQKVKQSILNIVDPGDAPEVSLKGDMVTVKVSELTLSRIVKSAKDKNMIPMFLKLVNADTGSVHKLMFNRQAAHAGRIIMCDDPQESPLGPIYLVLNDEALKYMMRHIK